MCDRRLRASTPCSRNSTAPSRNSNATRPNPRRPRAGPPFPSVPRRPRRPTTNITKLPAPADPGTGPGNANAASRPRRTSSSSKPRVGSCTPRGVTSTPTRRTACLSRRSGHRTLPTRKKTARNCLTSLSRRSEASTSSRPRSAKRYGRDSLPLAL